MAACTLHALSVTLFLLLFFAVSPAKAQQPYVNNHQLACEVRVYDNITNGFTCNGPPSCRSYLTFWSQPPYNTADSIAKLLNVSAAEIQSINNLPTATTRIPTRELVVIPANCSCSSSSGGFYQHNATYNLSGNRGDETYFSVANDTYQALSTCQAMMSQNRYGERQLTPGLNLLVPLRCACPTAKQTTAGFKYLLTYLVAMGDSISGIAEMFNSTSAAITEGNELTSDNIFFFTPVLVPLTTEPTKIVISPSPPPPPVVATPPQTPVDPPGSSSSHKWIYIGIGIGAGLLLLLSILALCFYKRRSKKKSLPSSLPEENKLFDSSTKQSIPTTTTTQWSIDLSNSSEAFGLKSAIESLTLYRFNDLQSATSNFSDENRIKGSVYRATINGDDAAVKVIKGDVSSSEINLLKKLNHSNIIRLSGFCIREGTSYLVFEYSENGSISDWLHSSGKKSLTWKQRVEIARDVAEALDYLHNYITPPHIHKNLESTNILLDSNFRAKIANFGVARILDEGDLDLQLTRHVEGTQGYLAPEYVENGVITSKLDVFAFGVAVLELLSGREAVTIHKKKEGEEEVEMLCKVINNVLGGENVREKLKEFMDPSLGNEYPLELAYTMAQLAKSCVATDLNSRPSVTQVLTTLSMIVSSSIDWEPSDDLLRSGSLGN
ncbi:Protein kinase domain [Arabidopsis thaliana x Arabidopsis arenosa]|uniref:LYK5 n=3 Tax=Arabidopsis TaxID=3701 RepID=A0A178VYW5_ARATH|nr:Protein kinase domain [Arabidopsis thaliana x Arabidopsis arenosa]KAG7642982.1 Protein kinase domain [Arabidopsis suecica]OAP11490.1 LYK5 [Arabidopsis thaliana]